jgi:hypothetical protein
MNSRPTLLLLRRALPIQGGAESTAVYDRTTMMNIDVTSGIPVHLPSGGPDLHATLHTDTKRETTDDE